MVVNGHKHSKLPLRPWMLMALIGNHQVLGVTATKRSPPQNWVIGATANPEIPKSATHNELQPRLVALREKLPTLHTLLVYSDVF